MAKILLVGSDRVSAALIEDRLRVEGHEVMIRLSPAEAAAVRSDLIILEMPPGGGLDALRLLREAGATRGLPVLAVVDGSDPRERVAALRAGADDLLARPFDLDELQLRAERLLGGRGSSLSQLQGDLFDHPPWQVVQYCQQAGKDGELVISSRQGSGRLRLRGGRVCAASWQNLSGDEAVLAFLGAREGRFRLQSADGSAAEAGDDDESLPVAKLILQSAWLQDELTRRRQILPATGKTLRAEAHLPQIDEEYAAVPIEEVFRFVRERPSTRIYDLVTALPFAPQKLRLAVAWLVEQAVVAAIDGDREAMSTTAISTSMVVQVVLHELIEAAGRAGFDVTDVTCLLLATPARWDRLEQLTESVPGFRDISVLRRLRERIASGGGSAVFAAEAGALSLHVQPLEDPLPAQVEALVPRSAGVMAWLDDATQIVALERLVHLVEESSSATVGVVVADTPEARAAAEKCLRRNSRWQVSAHPPQSLLGVLRLVHPRALAETR